MAAVKRFTERYAMKSAYWIGLNAIATFAVLVLAGCAGGSSSDLPNPVPSITSISPTFVTVGAVTQSVTINGTNFISDTTVSFNNSSRAAKFMSPTQLSLSLTSDDRSKAGCYDVTATNPAPGGGSSNSKNLVVSTTSDPIYVVDTLGGRVQVFTGTGSYASQFNYPFALPSALAMDCQQNIYVFDGNSHCTVDKFDSSGNFLLQFGNCGGGIGPEIFDNTGMIAVDGSGNVWVTSPDLYYMQKFDSSGQFLSIICMANTGVNNCPIATPIDVQPQGIAIDASGNIYVSNVDPFTGFNIIKFDGTGKYLATIGSTGAGDGQFSDLTSIEMALDATGNLYVTDSGNARVERFDSKGNYVSQFGSLGIGDGQFNAPTGIAIDGDANIYVTDTKNDRVQKFDPNGTYMSQFGTYGGGNGQFNGPYGIAVIK